MTWKSHCNENRWNWRRRFPFELRSLMCISSMENQIDARYRVMTDGYLRNWKLTIVNKYRQFRKIPFDVYRQSDWLVTHVAAFTTLSLGKFISLYTEIKFQITLRKKRHWQIRQRFQFFHYRCPPIDLIGCNFKCEYFPSSVRRAIFVSHFKKFTNNFLRHKVASTTAAHVTQHGM